VHTAATIELWLQAVYNFNIKPSYITVGKVNKSTLCFAKTVCRICLQLAIIDKRQNKIPFKHFFIGPFLITAH